MKSRWKGRGGVTAIAGLTLAAIGLLSALAGFGESAPFFAEVLWTGRALPASAETEILAVVAIGMILFVGGSLLIGFGRGERTERRSCSSTP
jgi:hypothetical protein